MTVDDGVLDDGMNMHIFSFIVFAYQGLFFVWQVASRVIMNMSDNFCSPPLA